MLGEAVVNLVVKKDICVEVDGAVVGPTEQVATGQARDGELEGCGKVEVDGHVSHKGMLLGQEFYEVVVHAVNLRIWSSVGNERSVMGSSGMGKEAHRSGVVARRQLEGAIGSREDTDNRMVLNQDLDSHSFEKSLVEHDDAVAKFVGLERKTLGVVVGDVVAALEEVEMVERSNACCVAGGEQNLGVVCCRGSRVFGNIALVLVDVGSVEPMRTVFPDVVGGIVGNLEQVHPTGDALLVIWR